MITDADIKKLKKVFATKEELSKMDMKLDGTFDLLRGDITSFKDQILHEIIKLREDITIVVGYRDMIEDHETRIGKIESKIYVSVNTT